MAIKNEVFDGRAVEISYSRNLCHIESSLAAFTLRDKGLVNAELFRNLYLCQSGVLTCLPQEIGKPLGIIEARAHDVGMSTYSEELVGRLWDYQRQEYPVVEEFFERPQSGFQRPPVFLKDKAAENVLHRGDASTIELRKLEDTLPRNERHRWFRSMKSSQALAQSVFGNLIVSGEIGKLYDLLDDDGTSAFGDAVLSPSVVKLEHSVNHLGEPRQTSLDVFVDGGYNVAVECKLSEIDIGRCSRPSIRPTETRYDTEYCNGSYRRQLGRKNRCSLSEIGVKYWDFIPRLFKWESNRDWENCPLYDTYQLVRNILAVCVKPDGTVTLNDGNALLLYDERNPAFQEGGKGQVAFMKVGTALREPAVLRKCSWQQLVEHLREQSVLPWLTGKLAAKYDCVLR